MGDDRMASDEDRRSGRFELGHKKMGGRQRGTPNCVPASFKFAVFEAARRVGFDGNGKDGVAGYMRWLAQIHPEPLIKHVVFRLMVDEEPLKSESPDGATACESNSQLRDRAGSDKPRKKDRAAAARAGNFDHDQAAAVLARFFQTPHTGAGEPIASDDRSTDGVIDSLMLIAIETPNAFCKLIGSTLLKTKKRKRGRDH